MIEAHGLNVPISFDDLCRASRTALLVYDMQAGIRSQLADGDRIVAQCGLVLAAARRAGMRVVYTRHLSSPLKWMGATQIRTAMAWQRTEDPNAIRTPFLRGQVAWEIVAELAPSEDDLIVDKLSMSALEGTPLAYALRDCQLTGLAICGIALEIGIEPTVRQATDLGFVPIVVTDACGSGNPLAGKRSMDTLRFVGEALLTDVASFCAQLDPPRDGRAQ